MGLDQPDDPLFSHRPRWATTAGVVRFLSDDLLSSLGGYDPVADLRASLPADFNNWGSLARAQYLELAQLLPGYILSSQGDRVSMAHAVEGRFPFLDYRVVEFAATLPPRLKLRGLIEKYLLRRSMQGDLPAAIAWRPKQPYRAPDSPVFLHRRATGVRAGVAGTSSHAADRVFRSQLGRQAGAQVPRRWPHWDP